MRSNKLLPRVAKVMVFLSVFSFSLASPAHAAPTNTALPVISGNISVGSNVSVNRGTWVGAIESYTYQWRRCPDAVNTITCTAIASANSATYLIQPSDAGKYLRVSVTALDVTGGTTVITSPSAIVATKPVNLLAPVVTGNFAFGNLLSSSAGGWSAPNAGVFTFKWYRCTSADLSSCRLITGTLGATYVLTTSDIGSFIRSEVSVNDVTNKATGVALSNATPAITSEPKNLTTPTISGDLVVGQVLKYDPGTWAAFPAATFTTAWQKCSSSQVESCATVAGQNGSTLTLVESDFNAFYRVLVSGINNFGGTLKYSSIVGPIVKPVIPVNTSAPFVLGFGREGETLSVSSGTWSGYPAPTFTYTWQRCSDSVTCTTVNGATSTSYKLTYEDAGYSVRAVVKASNSVGSASSNSNFITGITGLVTSLLPPQVTGTAVKGKMLTTDNGTWVGANAADFVYKWQSCYSTSVSSCADIPGAITSQYQVKTLEIGKYIRSGVAIKNNSQFAFSDLTTKVPVVKVIAKYVKGKSCTIKNKKVTSGTKILICKNVKGKLIWQ